MQDGIIQGRRIPESLLAEYRDSSDVISDGSVLRDRISDDGYVFLRRAIDNNDVMAARREVFERLAEVGEMKQPAIDGIFTGNSRRRERPEGLGEFWRSVSQGTALRKVSHGERAYPILSTVFGEPSRPHDYIFLRPGIVGNATHLHFDHPFFARGSNHIVTVWTALGDIPVDEGPLFVLEGSHRFSDLIDPVLQIDYDSNDASKVQMTDDAIEFAQQRGSRFLTTNFEAGDMIIFGMTTMHGSLDNHSAIGRTRLSCDVRWQPAADPIDERYVGDNPPGTTGAGYGELNGAKPLTEQWHTR